MTDNGCINLVDSIIVQACSDYCKLYKKIYKGSKLSVLDQKEYNNLVTFFNGEYIQLLTDIDGNYLKEEIERRVKDGGKFTISKEYTSRKRKCRKI